jgi:hypothetical protein
MRLATKFVSLATSARKLWGRDKHWFLLAPASLSKEARIRVFIK